MSIEQVDKIDFIGIEEETNSVILTISDHLDWNEPETHLLLLQEKLNNYLVFCEEGELYETYPRAKGKDIVIEVVAKETLSSSAKEFFEKAREIFLDGGFELRFNILPR